MRTLLRNQVSLSRLTPPPLSCKRMLGFPSVFWKERGEEHHDGPLSVIDIDPCHCQVTLRWKTGVLRGSRPGPGEGKALESHLTQMTVVLQGRTVPLPQPQEAQAQASKCTTL